MGITTTHLLFGGKKGDEIEKRSIIGGREKRSIIELPFERNRICTKFTNGINLFVNNNLGVVNVKRFKV